MAKRRTAVVVLIFTPRATARSRIQRQHGSRRRRDREFTHQRRRLGGRVCHLRGRWGGWLVSSVMHNPREKIFAPAGQFLHRFLGRSVFARAAGGLRRVTRQAGRWHRSQGRLRGVGARCVGMQTRAASVSVARSQGVGSKYIGERREAVVGLGRRDLMQVRA